MTTPFATAYESGRVVNVEERALGSRLVGAHASGATTLTVDDVTDFNESGGTLSHLGVAKTYTAIDYDTNVITLSGTLGAAGADGDVIYVEPFSPERYVHLRPNDSSDADSIIALLPHALHALLPLGAREQSGAEAVIVYDNGSEWVVSDITAKEAVVALEAVSGGDGLPPGASPTPTVRGGIGALFVEWDTTTNTTDVTYEVHVSTTSGFTPVAPPATTTYHGEIMAGTLYVVRTLPDGTALAYGTTYYVKIVARDVDGSATPSTQHSGSPVQVTGPDIVAGSITADRILANSITAAQLNAHFVVSNIFSTASEGSTGTRVMFSSTGIRLYNSDNVLITELATAGAGSAYFKGTIDASTITGTTLIGGRVTTNDTGQRVELNTGNGSRGMDVYNADGQWSATIGHGGASSDKKIVFNMRWSGAASEFIVAFPSGSYVFRDSGVTTFPASSYGASGTSTLFARKDHKHTTDNTQNTGSTAGSSAGSTGIASSHSHTMAHTHAAGGHNHITDPGT